MDSSLVVVGENHPFRMSVIRNIPQEIQAEMTFTCTLLREWKRYSPIVAGGAIWSWAAGKPCNDVDIFVHSTRWSRRRAMHQYGRCDAQHLLSTKIVDSHYVGKREIVTELPIERYKTLLPEYPVPVDFNLTPWKGAEVCTHFDFMHCAVAFGPKVLCTMGIEYYQQGLLKTQYETDYNREEKLVLKKTQPALWGKAHAGDSARRVLSQLQRTYKNLE